MLNLVLSIIIFYYLLKTGDLFKLIKIAKNLTFDLLTVFKTGKQNNRGDNNTLDILKLRYVQGEIDKEEYKQILKNL
ncbi:hypothetical protein ACSVDA_12630 [Cytobacillus sp. Hm23]